MNREEALQLLRGGEEGIKRWNERVDAGEKMPSLAKADLKDAKLNGAKLNRAILSEADLKGAHLFGAELCRADLKGAHLRGAVLFRAVAIEAYLSGADLREANLQEAKLWGAQLDGAQLWRAELREANLKGADLSGADLRDAGLHGTNLHGANLRNADLRNAGLSLANIREAALSGSDLTTASFAYTSIGDIDLSSVKGLRAVEHLGPSSVGVDTLYRSRGKIPDAFLRGCGLDPRIQAILLGDPKALTDAAYSAASKSMPFKLKSCFISYSTKDRPFVERLRDALNKSGVEYWYDDEHIKRGEGISEQIDREIHDRDRTILVCSEEALSSGWVRLEAEEALREEKRRKGEGRRDWRVLFPVMRDDSFLESRDPIMAKLRTDRVASDFRRASKGKAFEEEFQKLLAGLKAEER